MKKVTLSRPLRKPATVLGRAGKASPQKNTPTPPHPLGVGGGGSNFAGEKIKEEKITVSQLLELAAKLTVSQHRELTAQIALQALQAGDGPSRDKDMWSAAVYEALQTAVGAGDRASVAPMLVRRAMGASSSWLPVKEFMERSELQRVLKVTERQAVYQFLARLVIKRSREVAQHVKAPLSPKLVAGQASSISHLFDAEFPGYLAAGLAGIVAKRIISGYQPPDADDAD